MLNVISFCYKCFNFELYASNNSSVSSYFACFVTYMWYLIKVINNTTKTLTSTHSYNNNAINFQTNF